jgi:hypothetical protein
VQDDAARDLQLLINHREVLVRQRSEAQDRLRWLLHDIDPDVQIPAAWKRFARLSGTSHGRSFGCCAKHPRSRR